MVHDLAGQVEDGGVVVQDEVGVGRQDDPIQFEGESAGVAPNQNGRSGRLLAGA